MTAEKQTLAIWPEFWEFDFLKLTLSEYHRWASLRQRQLHGKMSVAAQFELNKLEKKARLELEEARARVALWQEGVDRNLAAVAISDLNTARDRKVALWLRLVTYNCWLGQRPSGTLTPDVELVISEYLEDWSRGWARQPGEPAPPPASTTRQDFISAKD